MANLLKNAWWMLAVRGALAVLLAVILIASPGAGALALVQLIGVFVLFIGVLLLVLAITIRRWQHDWQLGVN